VLLNLIKPLVSLLKMAFPGRRTTRIQDRKYELNRP